MKILSIRIKYMLIGIFCILVHPICPAAATGLDILLTRPIGHGAWPMRSSDTLPANPQTVPAGLVGVIDHLPARVEVEEGSPQDVFPIESNAGVGGVFDSVAIPIRNFPVVEQWTRIMHEISKCSGAGSCPGEDRLLRRISKETEGKTLVETLHIVNFFVNNAIEYRTDQSLYGKVDYWANPAEILLRESGDCEDFAILKMTSLIRAGIPRKSLSLVVLRDRRRGAFHAVLAVNTNFGSFILDSTRKGTAMDTSLSDYQPLYSLSDNRAWVHGSKVWRSSAALGEGAAGS